MIKWFLQHLWKEAKRSSNFSKNVALNITMGFFIFLSLLYVLLLGLFLGRILPDVYPDLNPVWVFNSALLYYVAIDLLLRFLIQGLPRLNIDTYLHLPIRKSTIINFVVARTKLNFLNFIPLLIIIPFTINVVSVNYDMTQTIAWFFALLFIVLGNNFFGTYLKRLLASKPSIVGVFGLLIMAMVLFDYFDVYSLSIISADLFGSLLSNPILFLLPFAYMMGAYLLHYYYLRRRLYSEEIDTKKKQRVDAISRIKYFKSLGYFGTLIALDLKLLWRHKRTRTVFYMAPIFLLYGFMFYTQEIYMNMVGMLIFVGIFMTGGMMINYGNYAMAYESNYFDSLLANNFDFRQYFRMKFINSVLICSACYIITIPYVFFSTKVLLINTVAFLFNIGIISFTLLFIATFNKKRMDMNKGAAFNYQGLGASNWLAMFPAFLLPIIIYWPFSMVGMPYTGLIFIGILGLIGLLFNKTLTNIIYRNFLKRKYIMADGFREK